MSRRRITDAVLHPALRDSFRVLLMAILDQMKQRGAPQLRFRAGSIERFWKT
jgi:hypothetical protein